MRCVSTCGRLGHEGTLRKAGLGPPPTQPDHEPQAFAEMCWTGETQPAPFASETQPAPSASIVYKSPFAKAFKLSRSLSLARIDRDASEKLIDSHRGAETCALKSASPLIHRERCASLAARCSASFPLNSLSSSIVWLSVC